jgi:hypothetical protein
MEHKPPTRPGLIFGLALILALVLLAIGLVVLVLMSSITPLTVLWALLLVSSLGVIGLVLYSLSALRHAAYRLDRSAISIRWGPIRRVIPLSEVEGILQPMDLGAVTRFRGLHWPGFWAGRGRMENVGAVEFFSTGPLEQQLVIKTAGGAYAISPQNPNRFLDRFAGLRGARAWDEAEPPAPPPAPAPRRAGLWSDRLAHGLIAAGGLLNLALMLLLTARLPTLPYRLPFRFSPAGEVLLVGSPRQLLVVAAVGAALWALNGALGVLLYRRLGERVAAYLLWGGAAVLQVLLAVALWNLAGF